MGNSGFRDRWFGRGGTFVCVIAQHPHLTLREGDRDAVVEKGIPKRQVDIAADIGQPGGGIGYPEPQDIVDRTVAEAHDMAHRLFAAEHPFDPLRGLYGYAAHLVRVVMVGGAEIDVEPDEIV